MKKMNELCTEALVLRRTNYGEADRILNIISPSGKKTVLAKGVRKEKSKLAGGVEMFCLSELVLHQGKTDFMTLTSAKMLKFYQNILGDLERIELASDILKRVSKAAEMVESEEFFSITKKSLEAIDKGGNLQLIQAWFLFHLAKTIGEQINIYSDNEGKKLEEKKHYAWSSTDNAFYVNSKGNYKEAEIKLLRLMVLGDLSLVLRIAEAKNMAEDILYIAKSISQI